ncbi:MAG: membrane protein insertase YidC [Bacteroidales bacterium]|nr:membrane protein insertase YidC [Bacteroidales bacterium]
MLDKHTIIGLVLMFLVFIGYIWWTKPSKEEIEKQKAYQDSVYQAYQDSVASVEEALAAQKLIDDSIAANDTVAQQNEAEKIRSSAGAFACNLDSEPATISVKNEVLSLDINALGAKIDNVVLSEYTSYGDLPLDLIAKGSDSLNLVFGTKDNKIISTGNLVFTPFVNGQKVSGDQQLEISGTDSVRIAMRAFVSGTDSASTGIDEERYLEFAYIVYGNSHEVKFDINFHGLENVLQDNHTLDLYFSDKLTRHEKHATNKSGRSDMERFYSSIYYKPTNDNADNLRDGTDGEEIVKSPLQWIAFKQQFFSTILIADSSFDNAVLRTSTQQDSNSRYLCDMESTIGLPFQLSKDYTIGMRYYFGSNKYRTLRNMDLGLERMLPLGWGFFAIQWVNRFAIIPVFNFLEQFNWNYGIIIIVLTLLVKLVLFPIAYKSYSSSAVMRILQPEVAKINEKFPKQEDALKKQQAISALYKKAGASPMAGCLPMLLQMPILFAMYRFFPASIELRQQPFLWAEDLSTFDSILNLPFNIPLYGDHISLFCLLMFAVQFVYTWYTMRQQASQQSIPGMKFMMYFMPFMMLFMLNSLSAALNFYYFLSLCITMLQMIIIRHTINEDKIRKRIELANLKNKNKPPKKSGFMKRLEEMQKQAEQMQKNGGKK